jgi:adhesin/invasin
MSPLSSPLTRLLGLSVLCLGFALGCGGESDPRPLPPAKPLPDATLSRVEVSRATQVLADGEDRVTITVTVKQEDGTPLEGRTVHVEVSGDGNTVTQPVGRTDAEGKTTASVVSSRAGAKKVTASVDADGGAVVLGMRPVIDFTAPRVTRLAFTATALTATAGAPVGNLEIHLQDARGRTVTAATDVVTLSLAAGPGDATLEGTLKATPVEGVARFTEVVLKKAGTGYQLKVEAPGLEGATSPTFAVAAAPAASLEVSGLAPVVTAGTPQGAQVTLRDAFGNVATGYTGTLAVTSSDASADLPAAHTFTSADAGRFTFTGVLLKRAGAQQVTFQDAAAAALTSRHEVGVVAGEAAALAFLTVPTRASVRAVLSPVTVELRDAWGNRAAVGTPHVMLRALPDAGGLEGALALAPVDGVATFTDVRMNREGRLPLTAFTLVETIATATANIDIVDDVAPARPTLVAGAATPTSATVTWTAVGDDGTAGTATAQELRVAESPILTDADFQAADLVPGVGAPATAGTAESATVEGLLPSRGYHVALRVTDNRGNSVRSTSLPLQTQDPVVTRLAFTVQPSGHRAGQALGEFRVALLDVNGDTVRTATSPVTLTLAGEPGFTPITVVPVDGVAAFTGVVVEKAGTHRFSASANSLSVESNPFTIDPEEAVRLALTGLVSPVTAGMAGNLVVTAYDRFDNVATGYTRSVHFTSDDAQATLPGEYAFTAADAGRHVFNNVVLVTSGPRRVTVTELMATPLSASLAVEVTSDAADRLELSGLPGDVTAGASNTLTLSARDRFGNLVTGFASTVRFSADDPRAVLPADFTFVPGRDAGQHAFSATLRSAGPRTITVTDLGTGRTVTANTRVAPAAAARMTLALSTSTAAAGQPVEATVTLLDAFDNHASGYRGTVGFQVLGGAQATLPGPHAFTEADAGQHTFSVTFETVGNLMLVAQDTVASSLADDERITVGPGVLAELRVERQSGDVVAGQAAHFVVTAHDRFGNRKTDYTGTVDTTTTDPNPGPLESHAYTAQNQGEWVFRVVHRTAGPQTVTFTDVAAGVSGTNALTVEAASPVRLVYLTAPSTGVTHQPLAQVQVALRDAFDNTPRVAAPAVTLMLGMGPPGTTLGGTRTVAPVDGVATFTGLTVDQEGLFRLAAQVPDPSISSVDTELTITDTQPPAPAAAFTVTLVDNDTVRVTWQASGDDGSAGTASAYDLRLSPESLTEDNVNSAPQLPTAIPKPSGEMETFTFDMPPAQATTWHFGLRIYDGAGNVSRLVVTSLLVPGPCGGVVCTPPASECQPDNVTLVTYAGACVVQGRQGVCEYTPIPALCEGPDGVCFEGACTTAGAPAENELAISEVMHSPSAGTTEYIELTSTTDRLLNLNNLFVTYDDGSGNFQGIEVQGPGNRPVLVPAGATFVLAANGDIATNGGVPTDFAYEDTFFRLANTGRLWLQAGETTVTEQVYTPAFPSMEGRAMNLVPMMLDAPEARQHAWYWCNSVSELPGGDRGTPGQPNNTCLMDVEGPVEFCNIQWPKSFPTPIPAGEDQTVYSSFFDWEVTNRNPHGNDHFPFIAAELGFGPSATAPETWQWSPATPNPGYSVPEGGGNDDETMGTLSITTPGSYFYGFRYRFTQGPGSTDWVYCDQDGVVSPSNPADYGRVTVSAPLAPEAP